MRITYSIVAVCMVVFLLQNMAYSLYCTTPLSDMCIISYTPDGQIEKTDPITYHFSLVPENAFSGEVWQFFTYIFLHAGPLHLMFNMFVLLIFGGVVEHALGEKRFLILYFASGIGGALLHIFLTGVSDTLLIGASGSIFGVLAAYGFMFPKNKIIVFPIPFPLPSWIAVVGIAVLEFIVGLLGLEAGVANFGHLGGILTGALLVYYWKRQKPRNIYARRKYEFFWE